MRLRKKTILPFALQIAGSMGEKFVDGPQTAVFALGNAAQEFGRGETRDLRPDLPVLIRY
jgi:hypothetical protein